MGERLSEGRGRSLSSVKWFCKEAKYCACSHPEKCSPTALEECLVTCSFKRLNLSLFMTLIKNFHILFPTKINFLLYLAVMLYMRSLAQVVAKHISA